MAKFCVDIVQRAENHGFKPHELRRIQRITEQEQDGILTFCHDYFND
jgi:hypothetical protein